MEIKSKRLINLKWLLFILFAFMLFVFSSSFAGEGNSSDGQPEKNVLILLNQSPLLPRNQKIIEGIAKAKKDLPDYIHFIAEYTDFDRIDKEAFKRFHAKLVTEYGVNTFDIVICSWIPEAAYAQQYWPDTPLVNLSNWKGETGAEQIILSSPLTERMEKTIAFALSLRGVYSECWVILGDLPEDSPAISQFKLMLIGKGCKSVHMLSSRTPARLVSDLAGVSSEDVVYFFPFAFDDNQKPVVPREYIQELCRVSKAPVFSFHSQMLGQGVIGGQMIDPLLIGKSAGIAIKEYFEKGAFISHPQISFLGVDATATHRFFPDVKIQEDAVVVNPLPSLLSDSQIRILLVIALALIIALIVAGFVILKKTFSLNRANGELIRTRCDLERLATTDPLTGAYNRRSFLAVFDKEVKRSIRYKRNFALLMMDIDHFKKINDTYGHATGDRVLKLLVAKCTSSLRESDIFARWGGEEFIIVLPEAEISQASITSEKLRGELARSELVADDGSNFHFSVSIGFTTFGGDQIVFDEIIKKADQALYMAKKEGRNRVVAL